MQDIPDIEFTVVDGRIPPALFVELEQVSVLISPKITTNAKLVYLQIFYATTFKQVNEEGMISTLKSFNSDLTEETIVEAVDELLAAGVIQKVDSKLTLTPNDELESLHL